MANPERYVTASDLQNELPFDDADLPMQDATQFDSALNRALESASDAVEQWGETVYQTTTATESLDRPAHVPESDLPMPRRPVQSVQSVDVDGTALTEGDDYVVESTHLSLVADPASGVDEWPTDQQSVTVEWTHGFSELPGPVEEAIIRLARSSLDQIETDGYSADEDGWQIRPPAAIKSECAAMVDDYSAPSYYTGAMMV